MSGVEDTPFSSHEWQFSDDVAGRITAELYYLRGSDLAEAIDTQFAPLVGARRLITTARDHGTHLTQGRLRVRNGGLIEGIHIESRLRVFMRGAFFAANIELHDMNDPAEIQLLDAYVPRPFPHLPMGGQPTRKDIETYETEARIEINRLPSDDREAIHDAATLANKTAAPEERRAIIEDFKFGYMAVRRAIADKRATLEQHGA